MKEWIQQLKEQLKKLNERIESITTSEKCTQATNYRGCFLEFRFIFIIFLITAWFL